MRITKVISLLPVLILGTAFAQDEAPAEAAEAYAHLEKGKSGFKETWINPDTDWNRFDSLYLWEAEFQYRDVGPARRTRSTMMNTRQREFGISDEDRETFEQTVSESFVKEIQRAKNFKLVDEIGPNTLIMRGAVLDIISKVPPETVGRSDVYLSNIGEATLVLELIDSGDGEIVAVVAERRALQSGTGRIDEFSMPTSRVTVLAEIRRWAQRSASKLRAGLDKAIAGK
jgi:hypothetical protein